jgi:hypothetical protein
MFCKKQAILNLFFFCGFSLVRVFGQTPDNPYLKDTMPIRGAMPFSDQISSPADSIDPQSGKVNLSVPLASLPSGRGGIGFDLALTYDSHLYDPRIVPIEVWQGQNQFYLNGALPIPSATTGGWNYNYLNITVAIEQKYYTKDSSYVTSCTDEQLHSFRIRVGLPDGSMHIMYNRYDS